MHRKQLTRRMLVTKVRAWRRHHKKIVFTNGCFDLLHVGHVRYLSKARSLGDLLIVAVNTDASVRTLKGNARPLTPLAQRLEILSALSCVDYVIPFHASTPVALIAWVKPDVLVKGADWPEVSIVGRDIVKAYGGRVARIKMVPGTSTTLLIRRIVKGCATSPP